MQHINTKFFSIFAPKSKCKEYDTLPTNNSQFRRNVLLIIGIIVVLFSASIILMMIYDYRLYLANKWGKKYSFADFLKREQFYIYILLFFLLTIVGEVWMYSLN